MDRPIFLVGFMGSGKTTWGKKLASALEVPFIDMDHLIVEKIGMSIPEYFKAQGEDAFRELEQAVMKEQEGRAGIISTGGGTPCFFDNMDWLLDHGTVLYLNHSAKSLWKRLSQSDVNKRPALKGFTGEQLLAFIEEKLQERAPYYNRAHIHVDQINTSLAELLNIVKDYHQTHEKKD